MAKGEIAYVELPTRDVPTLKRFYGSLFGWTYEDYGPEYATVHGSGLEAGFNGDTEGRTAGPLVMVETDEIEAVQRRVAEAGGTITEPLFQYPGGRRFHFTDPSGNELAVMQPDRPVH